MTIEDEKQIDKSRQGLPPEVWIAWLKSEIARLDGGNHDQVRNKLELYYGVLSSWIAAGCRQPMDAEVARALAFLQEKYGAQIAAQSCVSDVGGTNRATATAPIPLPPNGRADLDEDLYMLWLRRSNRAKTMEALLNVQQEIPASGLDLTHPKVVALVEDLHARIEELQPQAAPIPTPLIPIASEPPAGLPIPSPVVKVPADAPAAAPTAPSSIQADPPEPAAPQSDTRDRVRAQASLAEQQKIDQLLAEMTPQVERAHSISELEGLRTQINNSGVDTANEDVRALDQEIVGRINTCKLIALKNRLREAEDIGELEQLIREAQKAQSDLRKKAGFVDSALEELLKQAQERFDAKRQDQGSRTTREGLRDVNSINAVLRDLEAAIRQGETTFFDARSNTIRPIHLLSTELIKEREGVTVDTSNRSRTRAMQFMPAQGARYPELALEKLKEAFVEGLPQSARDDLLALEADWTLQKDQSDRVTELLGRLEAEPDVVKRLWSARQARGEYPYHPNVYTLDAYIQPVNHFFSIRLTRAIEQGRQELESEADEAGRQREERRVTDEELPIFQQVLEPIHALEEELSQLNPTVLAEAEYSPELVEKLQAAKHFRALVQRRRERRKTIRLECDQIIQLLKDPATQEQAKTRYKNLPDDFKMDQELAFVHKNFLEPLYQTGELYALAVEQYTTRQWAACQATCVKIQQEGANKAERFDQQVIDLHKRAGLQLACQEIDETWQNGYYLQCAQRMDYFRHLCSDYHPLRGYENLVMDLQRSSQIEDRQREIERRKEADRSNNLPARMREFNTQVNEIARQSESIEKAPRATPATMVKALAVKITGLYEQMGELIELETSYVGELRDLRASLGRWLHRAVLPLLTTLNAGAGPDFELAYILVDCLHRCDQVQVEDADLRRWAVLGYYRQQAEENRRRATLEANERPLEQNIANWREASRRFHIPRVEQEAEYACSEYLIFRVDRVLKNGRYEQAQNLLEGQERLPALDGFDLDSAPDQAELELRRQVIYVLSTVENLFQLEDYDAIPELLKGLADTLEGAALPRAELKENRRLLIQWVTGQRERMARNAANNLIGEGDRMSPFNPAGAVGLYARALNLLPGHVAASARLRQVNPAAVRRIVVDLRQAANKIEQTRPASPNYVSNEELNRLSLPEILDQLNRLSANLKHIQLAARHLGLTEHDLQELSQKQAAVEEYRNGLSTCSERLYALRVGQYEWKGVLRSQNWGLPRSVLFSLEAYGILAEQADYQDLSARLAAHIQACEALQRWRIALEGAFQADEFDPAIDLYDKVVSEVSQAQQDSLKAEAQAARQAADAAQAGAAAARLEADRARNGSRGVLNENWAARREAEAAQKEKEAKDRGLLAAQKESAAAAEPPFPPEDPYGVIARETKIFDVFFRKQVRFWPEAANSAVNGSAVPEDLPLRPLLVQRKANLAAWEMLEAAMVSLYGQVVMKGDEDLRPRRGDPTQDTKLLLREIQKYLAFGTELEKLRPRMDRMPKPISQLAEEKKNNCQKMLTEMLRGQALAKEDEQVLVRYEFEIQRMIDQAVADFQVGNIPAALLGVERAVSYYLNSGDPNEEFLLHLQNQVTGTLQ